MRAKVGAILLVALASALLSSPLAAEERPAPGATTGPQGAFGLVPFGRGAYLHQLAADIDDGGRYSVDRAAFQAGPAYGAGPGRFVALALGYRYDGYHFAGDGVFGTKPWGQVHTFSVAVPLRWQVDSRWTVFAVPLAAASAEGGAAYEDAITGGAIAGFTYCVRKTLKIGPGVGVTTQIADDPSVFPVLLVEWDITPTFRLETGTGLGATQGPGLTLRWRPRPSWEVLLGGRYDRLRFRLDDNGPVPGGIGQDASIGILASVQYRFGPQRLAYVGLLAGVDFAGGLRLEDPDGRLLASQGRKATVALGLTFGVGF